MMCAPKGLAKGCRFWDINDPFNCQHCEFGLFFNERTRTCDKCSDLLNNCERCSHDGFTCDICEEGYDLNTQGRCWMSGCQKFKMEGNVRTDICEMCKPGMFLHVQTGTCKKDCGYGWVEDPKNHVCRRECSLHEYYDPTDPENCLRCEDAIENCDACSESNGVGSQLMCHNCGPILTPSRDGLQCEHANCRKVKDNDPMNCEVCDTGYYKAYDTTKCWKDCPSEYWSHEVDAFTNFRLCGPQCDTKEYLSH